MDVQIQAISNDLIDKGTEHHSAVSLEFFCKVNVSYVVYLPQKFQKCGAVVLCTQQNILVYQVERGEDRYGKSQIPSNERCGYNKRLIW